MGFSFTVQFKTGGWLSSIDSAVAAAPKMLGDKQPNLSTHGVILLVQATAGDDEDEWDFGDMQTAPSSGCERHGECGILSKTWSGVWGY